MARTLKIGSYDTAAKGFTLTGLSLSDPEMKNIYIEKVGGDGAWDLSTVLTDGVPKYKNRKLVATLELSGGTRSQRLTTIQTLIASHDGYERQIVHPDRPSHYLKGRVHIAVRYNDNAHAGVTVTVDCEPWFYESAETSKSFTASSTSQAAIITLNGRLTVAPTVTVTGGPIKLTFRGKSTQFSEGTYQWAELIFKTGNNTVTYTGTGTFTLTYREAVLL
jgi:hypothetical protein